MENPNSPPIAILGAGSWGTALALYLARRGQEVHLWIPDKSRVDSMTAERANNRYLPGYTFPDSLHVTDQLSIAIEGRPRYFNRHAFCCFPRSVTTTQTADQSRQPHTLGHQRPRPRNWRPPPHSRQRNSRHTTRLRHPVWPFIR